MTLHEQLGLASHERSLRPLDPRVIVSERDLRAKEIRGAARHTLIEQAKQAAKRGDEHEMYLAFEAFERTGTLSGLIKQDIIRSLAKARRRARAEEQQRLARMRRAPLARNPRKRRSTRSRPRHRNGRFKKLLRKKRRNPLPRWVDRRSIRTIFRGKGKKSRRILVGCPKGSWAPRRKRCKKGMRLVEKKRR